MRRTDSGESVMAVLRMGQPNATAHLEPLAAALAPRTLHVVRPEPRPASLTASNIRYWEVKGPSAHLQVVRTFFKALIVARTEHVGSIVSFNAYPYGLLASLIGIATRRPFHIGFVGSDLQLLNHKPWWWRMMRRASVITTPGPQSTHIVRQAGYNRMVQTLRHGVDDSRFNPRGQRDLSCLFVGALLERKRVDLAILAMQLVVRREDSARLVIVGDGPLGPSLQTLVNDLGLSDYVNFEGYQEQPERWMQRARVVLFPSQWEGLPFAMIEAMRCGAVPIATPVASVPDLISHQDNGILVDDPTPEALSAAILDVLQNDDHFSFMSLQAVQSTRDYTYDSVAFAWKDIIHHLPELGG